LSSWSRSRAVRTLGEAKVGKEKEQREASDFLAYRDREGGVADFHSLRHTFITNLVNAGVMPKDAKELARHSTITLTMDRYAHVGIRDTAAAVARLSLPTSSRPTPESAVVKATGTDGGCTAYVPADVPTGGNARGRLRTDENIGGGDNDSPRTKKPLHLQGFEDDRGRSVSGEGGIRTLCEIHDESAVSALPGAESGASAVADLNIAPELAALIDAWPRLPDPIKAGILALVRAANPGR
jgi:hypothetical protein